MTGASGTETIAAIATPLGRGGVGIVRISGPASRSIGARLFLSARQGFDSFKPYVLHHGWVTDHLGHRLDEVLVSFMPAPGSYTGEDVVELNCHGGPAVLQAVLEAVLQAGARMAGPGEFTLRAFLNGRMDLSQAESVAETVCATTRAGLRLAGAKLQGGLGRRVSALRDRLRELRSMICAAVDFPEEEGDDPEPGQIRRDLQAIREDIGALLQNYRRHSLWREGALIVLAGPVNAGKSSLLNALLGRNRAIVTETPGTTRDYLEESLNLEGLPVRIADTAGLRETRDQVERAGMDQGREVVQRADLVGLVFDWSLPADPELQEIAELLGPERVLGAANKSDLPEAGDSPRHWLQRRGFECIRLSAKTGAGLDSFLERTRQRLLGRSPEPEEGELVPNMRQKQHLADALQELEELEQALSSGLTPDLLDFHLQAAAESLSGITGEISSEDVLEQVFSRFCIGK
jgi:tRNA modification GTPase